MTRDDVLRIAHWMGGNFANRNYECDLLEFAALLIAEEREQCARLCDEAERQVNADLMGVAAHCANAIRGRGNP